MAVSYWVKIRSLGGKIPDVMDFLFHKQTLILHTGEITGLPEATLLMRYK